MKAQVNYGIDKRMIIGEINGYIDSKEQIQ